MALEHLRGRYHVTLNKAISFSNSSIILPVLNRETIPVTLIGYLIFRLMQVSYAFNSAGFFFPLGR